MKILYYVSSKEYGGAERYIVDVIKHFSEVNDVYLVCKNPNLFKNLDLATVIPFASSFFRQKGKVKGIKKLFNQITPDIIHFNFHSPYSCRYGVLAAASILPEKRMLGTVHNARRVTSRYPCLGSIRTRLAPKILRHVGLIVVPSKASHDMLSATYAVPREKIRVMYNGFPAASIQDRISRDHAPVAVPGDRVIIGTVSRLAPEKGLDTLLNAFALAHAQMPELFLLLVGGGRLESALRTYACELGIANDILFTGYRDDVNDIIPIFQIAIVPSDYESFPYSLGEAMIQGKPCIATNVGGIPEMVGENGARLVPPKDPASLAMEILSLAKDKAEQIKLGIAARERIITCFTMEGMYAELEALYTELIA